MNNYFSSFWLGTSIEINSKNYSLILSGWNISFISISLCASIYTSEGIKENTLEPFLLYIPCAIEVTLNFIPKFETFYTLNVFSAFSPSTNPPIFNKPFSGISFTSGRTPFPINFALTQVVLHLIFNVSSKGLSYFF